MSKLIQSILEEKGPCDTSTLSKFLQEKGVTYEAARQQISRAKGKVRKLSYIKFPHNGRYVYLEEQYNSEQFWENLIKAFGDTNSVYGYMVHSLEARNGYFPKSYLPIISGSPIIKTGDHLSHEKVIEHLTKIGFLTEIHDDLFGSFIVKKAGEDVVLPQYTWLKAQMRLEEFLVLALKEWLARNSLVSFYALKTRADENLPKVGPFNWDISAPCYLSPLRDYKKSKSSQAKKATTSKLNPGFVVADVIYNEEVTKQQIGYFINKCKILKNYRNSRPFLALLVSKHFTKEALNIGRKEGLIFTTPTNLFGEDIAEMFLEMRDFLENISIRLATKPGTAFKLIDKLVKLTGLNGNIRGDLFEMLVGHCVQLLKGGYLSIGKVVENPSNGKKTDIDVFLRNEKVEIWCCECKGYMYYKEVTDSEVSYWVEQQIPTIRAWLKHAYPGDPSKRQFEFWTTGVFSEEAKKYLEEVKHQTKKIIIEYKDGNQVRNYFKQTNDKSFTDKLKKYYNLI